jgi:two-component system, OmpR family, phosphate regulon sensor histidine kinase PhoR
MWKSIRWRVALPYMVLVVLTMLGLGIYLSNLLQQTYQETWRINLTADARLLAEQIKPQLEKNPQAGDLETAVKDYARILNTRVTIIRSDGVVLGESDADPTQMENHWSRPEVQQALTKQEGNEVRYSATLKTIMLYVAVPVIMGEQVSGIVRLAVPFTQLDAIVSNLTRTIFLTALIALVIAVLLSIITSTVSLQPLNELIHAAQQMGTGNFRTSGLPDGTNEIGQLGQALRKMAEQLDGQFEALKAERTKLAAVLAQMTDGVIIVNAEGKVELANLAARRIFQIQETGAGHSLVEVIRYHRLVDLWRKCKETNEQQTTTLEVSAEHLFLQGIALPLGSSLPGGTLLLFQDLTRLRRLEMVRRDFVSNVSHELRTPLASLKALAETLQEGALEDPPAARRFLTRMETEIDTLAQLVRELLELSRIESGKVPLQRQLIDPCALILPAVERMTVQAERAGLSLHMDCPNDLPQIMADPERMEQVMVNLLHNAIKFTPPGGKIAVAGKAEGDRIIISVKDSGVGIADNDLPRIFERFYKADRARSGGGTGLGLSIARHLIEAHGGQIWAESTVGTGSTFYFSLPTGKV